MKQNLLLLRKRIDKIDNNIVGLIAKRMAIAKKIVHIKKLNKLKLSDIKREKEIIGRIKKIAKSKKINDDFIKKIFGIIINESKKIQKIEMKK